MDNRLECHIPEFDQAQPRPQTTSVHLSPISGYSHYPWSPTLVPPQITWITWTIRLLGLSMTSYGLPHLDLIISLSCHLLNLTCTRLILRDPVSMPLGSLGTAPIHSPRSCTLPSLRLVLSLSTTLSVFRHCLVIILYKPGLCSTSTLVRISRCVLVLSPHRHVTVFIPMPSKFHLSSWLPHLTFLSVPPKSTLDLELQNRTILVVVPSCRPLLSSHSKSIWLVPSTLGTDLPYHPRTFRVPSDWLGVAFILGVPEASNLLPLLHQGFLSLSHIRLGVRGGNLISDIETVCSTAYVPGLDRRH